MTAAAMVARPETRGQVSVSDGLWSSYLWCLRDGLPGFLAVLVIGFLNAGMVWDAVGSYLGSPSIIVPVVLALIFAPAIGLLLDVLASASLSWVETWFLGPLGDEVLRAAAQLHDLDRDAWRETELLRSGWLLSRSLSLLAALTTIDAIAVEHFGWFGWRGNYESWTVATAAGFFILLIGALMAREEYVQQTSRLYRVRVTNRPDYRARFTGTVADSEGAQLSNASVAVLVGPALTGAVLCGQGNSDTQGRYTVDLQDVPRVTEAGAATHFLVNGQPAKQTAKLPGNPEIVKLDLLLPEA